MKESETEWQLLTINRPLHQDVTCLARIILVFQKLHRKKSLLAPLNKKSGRNSYGRITVRHRGGGNRRKYRIIDFKRTKHGIPATVQTLEYDPNRSAFIALVQYEDGEKRYILAPNGLKVGDIVVSGPDADIKPGNAFTTNQYPNRYIYS